MVHPEFSVVVPVYNSENTLRELYEKVKEVFKGLGASFEIVFVDDGSSDRSWEMLGTLKQANPDTVTAIKLNGNYGQHNATVCGFSFSKGDRVITLDDDLQHPPEEIIKMIRISDETGADVVYGIYNKKQHALLRNIGSASMRSTSRMFMKGTGKGSSFRLIKKTVIDKMLEHYHHFIFIDEVLLWYTNDFAFVNVDHHKRAKGRSGYTSRKLISLVSDLIYFYTNIPLKLMVYGGLIVSIITFILGVQFILKKLLFDLPLGYTSLITAILFSTSVIVFSLGVIGGYLSRIYAVQNKKPTYTIKKVL